MDAQSDIAKDYCLEDKVQKLASLRYLQMMLIVESTMISDLVRR